MMCRIISKTLDLHFKYSSIIAGSRFSRLTLIYIVVLAVDLISEGDVILINESEAANTIRNCATLYATKFFYASIVEANQ